MKLLGYSEYLPIWLEILKSQVFQTSNSNLWNLLNTRLTRGWRAGNRLSKKLLPSEKRAYFVKFNVDGLLRGDYASRMNGYAVARQNGWMSANDIRELEDMNRIPAELGGDLYLVNGNMTKLADAGAFAGKTNSETEGSKNEQITKTKTGSPFLELDTKR